MKEQGYVSQQGKTKGLVYNKKAIAERMAKIKRGDRYYEDSTGLIAEIYRVTPAYSGTVVLIWDKPNPDDAEGGYTLHHFELSFTKLPTYN